MTMQTLTIGKRKYVLIAERDFRRLQKRAGELVVREEFAADALRQVKAYRKTRKATPWTTVKRKLGL
jgi:hypothetical protein